MELTAVSAELAAGREEIRLLEEESEELRRAAGIYVDLEQVERYAVEELGLQRPRYGQIRYEDKERSDVVTVLYVERRDRLRRRWETCFP